MRIIVLKEEDIKILIDKLEPKAFQLKQYEHQEHVVNDIHRKFHYEVVNFFHKQGSTYPNT